KMVCENALSGKTRLCYPACYDNPATHVCRIIYDPRRNWEKELRLCPECRDVVRRWAKRKGYAFRSLRIAGA
ncbi:MAG: hypothetical protein ACPLRH_08290, partial [Desulfotomaculales bacterium]